MPRGRPLVVLTLEDEDRETLTRWTRRPKTAQALAQRARVVLAAAEGLPNEVIATDVSGALVNMCGNRSLPFVTWSG